MHIIDIKDKIEQILEHSGVRYCVCGAIRRTDDYSALEGMKRIDILVDNLEVVSDLLTTHTGAVYVGHPFTAPGRLHEFGDYEIALYHGTLGNWGAMQLYLTGNRLFTRIIRARARKMLYKLNHYGVWFREDQIAGRAEDQIFSVLCVKYVPPVNRNFVLGDRLETLII